MINLIRLTKVNSTNTYAKALLKSGEPLFPHTVVYALEQTDGRGRMGRSWESDKDGTLCMSLIIPHLCKASVTLLAALGVHRALKDICPNLQIKWPNDIICDNKKLCGILTESTAGGTVIGIGLNVNTSYFAEEIRHKATSLRILTNRTFDREEILTKVADNVFELIETHKGEFNESALSEYLPLCANINKQVSWDKNTGIATGVTQEGALLVKTETGIEEIQFGEVSVSSIY